mgnify:CR=1 FL=1
MKTREKLTTKNLKTEYRSGIPTIDEKKPRFSWEISAKIDETVQTAYRIEVSDTKSFESTVWDSGKRSGSDTFGIQYNGEPLACGKDYYWRVTVWDNKGNSATSDKAAFRTGIKNWIADWITPDKTENPLNSPLLRKEFISEKCIRAVLYIFTPGWYELYVNGEKPDSRVLAPNYAPCRYYYYDTYDITDRIIAGKNCIGVCLGEGYSFANYSRFAWRWKGKKRVIAELHIDYADGSRRIIPTDGSWKAKGESAVVYNHIYNGEHYNSRLEDGWYKVGYDDSDWYSAMRTVNKPTRKMKPSGIEPLKVMELIKPIDFHNSKNGGVIVDFGQNFAGWVKLTVKGAKCGEKIVIRHAEEIFSDGELDPYTNRTAEATDIYIASGNKVETYEPRFTYHGFRYAEITGFSGVLDKESVVGCAVYCGMENSGSFSCDYKPLNSLFSNISRSIKSNTYSVMTDCPMRDERTPCLMDTEPYKEMSTFMFDAASYWTQWIMCNFSTGGSPDWEGTQIPIAWHLYREYGDKRILKKGYPYFVSFIDYVAAHNKDLTVNERFGDWCAPKAEPDGNYLSSFSNVSEVSSALYYYELTLAVKIADILGKTADKARFDELAKKVKAAYNKRFFDENSGCYKSETLAPAVLPLYFGMVPDGFEASVYSSVINGITLRNNGHLDTGIFGTKYSALLLFEKGDGELLLEAFFAKDYPSFGYELSKGTTTLWEQWSDVKGDMCSHNHAMPAGAGTFIMRDLVGFSPIDEGYRRVRIKPIPVSQINSIEFSQHTQCGTYEIKWEKENGNFRLSVKVPGNCCAEIILPDGQKHLKGSGNCEFSCIL